MALWMPVQDASALEMRTWLSIDGKLVEAELVRVLGDKVELRKKDGAVIQVPKSALSFGDLDYVAENAPADKTKAALGSGTGPKPKLPNPAKDVKIDSRSFKKEAGDFKINSRTYRICETPHFKIMYMRPTDPMGIAELAERLWVDTAFFHSTFIPKWNGRRMGIIIVNDEEAYEDVGSWYADMIAQAGDKEGADKTRKTWPATSAGNIFMPQADADSNAIFNRLRVFRGVLEKKFVDQNGKVVKTEKEVVKGVWDPFRTHTLAQDLLMLHAGQGIADATAQGRFGVFTGHAFYKEILLNGRSGTNLIGVEGSGNDLKTASGFKDAKDWAPELRKIMKKEAAEWNPSANLKELFALKDGESANTRNIVFSYAFSRFLQSTPERLSAYNRLCAKIDVANQVPELAEIGALYGFDSEDAFIKAWIAWMDSPDFR